VTQKEHTFVSSSEACLYLVFVKRAKSRQVVGIIVAKLQISINHEHLTKPSESWRNKRHK
jgi:hypothetical protein